MPYSGLSDFFKKSNIIVSEGHTGLNQRQRKDIINILNSNKNAKNIMEIGFNAGHSAELFLKNSDAYVYSFDLGDHFHKYLKFGKQYININYPNRHSLVLGDSTIRVPKFAENNSEIKFDIIFIDGGHDYDIAYADLMNCRKLANENTIIIMDDIVKNPDYSTGWTVGPGKAWDNLINSNLLIETDHFDYGVGLGQSIGKYINL